MVVRGRSQQRKVLWAFVVLLVGISLGRLVNQTWGYAGVLIALGLDAWIIFDIWTDRNVR